ncbi:MAG: hypothetical protein ABJN14_03950 [Paracoccaceae bacterium]
MYKLVFFIVFASFGFIGYTVVDGSSDTASRFGPGGSKFVSVGSDTRHESKWRVPSVSEISIYVASLMGGFKDQGEQNPKIVHDRLATQVKESLTLAEEFGIPNGQTLFDSHLNDQSTSGARWEKVDRLSIRTAGAY